MAHSTPDILLVEDDPMTRLILGTLLREEGYAVREASNGDEAFRELGEKTPDLMVLDFYLPDTTGLKILTTLPSPVGIPVLIVTGYDDPAMKMKMLHAGARHFVVKDAACAYLSELPRLIARTLRERDPGAE